jgi:hypothetical protein
MGVIFVCASGKEERRRKQRRKLFFYLVGLVKLNMSVKPKISVIRSRTKIAATTISMWPLSRILNFGAQADPV